MVRYGIAFTRGHYFTIDSDGINNYTYPGYIVYTSPGCISRPLMWYIVDMDNFGHLDIYNAFVQYLRTLYLRSTAQLSITPMLHHRNWHTQLLLTKDGESTTHLSFLILFHIRIMDSDA